MRVLLGCERSGRARSAFRELGHEAWSCDTEPADDGSTFHFQCDVEELLKEDWDLAIFFPPCTYLAGSGIHWNTRYPGRVAKTNSAVAFVKRLLDADIPRIALENPVGVLSTRVRKPDQIIQPWMFGDPESKKTCLWLKNLPPLVPTNVLKLPPGGRWRNQTPSGQNNLGPSPDRAMKRSLTYPGIAAAMAAQWGGPALSLSE